MLRARPFALGHQSHAEKDRAENLEAPPPLYPVGTLAIRFTVQQPTCGQPLATHTHDKFLHAYCLIAS